MRQAANEMADTKKTTRLRSAFSDSLDLAGCKPAEPSNEKSEHFNLKLPEDTPQRVPRWATLEARAKAMQIQGVPSQEGAVAHSARAQDDLEITRYAARALKRAYEAAVKSELRTLVLLEGPRGCGASRVAEELENRGPLVDLSIERNRRDAEASPLAFLSRYSAVSSVVLLSAHLSPKLLCFVLERAGTPKTFDLGAKVPAVIVAVLPSLPLEAAALPAAASPGPGIRQVRIRTLTEAEIEGAAPTHLERLERLAAGDTPETAGLVIGEPPTICAEKDGEVRPMSRFRDILVRAMRGGYPNGRIGTADDRHDFFHDLIRCTSVTDLPTLSRIRDPIAMRRVYRMVAALSGEKVKAIKVGDIIGMRRQMVKNCIDALEQLRLVEEQPAWSGVSRFERAVRKPLFRITDSGWLCGLLGFCWTNPDALGPEHGPIIRRLLNGWVWTQLAAFTDNDPQRTLSHFALRNGPAVPLVIENRAERTFIAASTTPDAFARKEDFEPMARFAALLSETPEYADWRLAALVFTTGDTFEPMPEATTPAAHGLSVFRAWSVPMSVLWH